MPDEVAILLDKLLVVHKIHMQVLVLLMHTEGVRVDTRESLSVVKLVSGRGGRRGGSEKKEVIVGWKVFLVVLVVCWKVMESLEI
jgi:hypothetical protein